MCWPGGRGMAVRGSRLVAGQGASGKQGAACRQRQMEYWVVVEAASVGV